MTELTNWLHVRANVAEELASAGIAAAETEARWITEHVSGATASEWPEVARTEASPRKQRQCVALVARRVAGEPLQYVLGEWSFRELDLLVDARVLIPRPETEWVVEIALREAERIGIPRSMPAPDATPTHYVADLGTGSGAIAIALERSLGAAEVWAIDVSADAVEVARVNAIGNAARRLHVRRGSWFEPLPTSLRGQFSLVVSNPPYIAEHEFDQLPSEVRDHEPYGALISGPSGLECIETLVAQATDWLHPGGALVCEIAPHQADACRDVVATTGGYDHCDVVDDLSGRGRVLVARTQSSGRS